MLHNILMIVLIVDAIAMVVTVLLQSGRSAGLSGAITGGAEQLFGKKKARGMDAVLGKATVVMAVLFFILAIGVAFFI